MGEISKGDRTWNAFRLQRTMDKDAFRSERRSGSRGAQPPSRHMRVRAAHAHARRTAAGIDVSFACRFVTILLAGSRHRVRTHAFRIPRGGPPSVPPPKLSAGRTSTQVSRRTPFSRRTTPRRGVIPALCRRRAARHQIVRRAAPLIDFYFK